MTTREGTPRAQARDHLPQTPVGVQKVVMRRTCFLRSVKEISYRSIKDGLAIITSGELHVSVMVM